MYQRYITMAIFAVLAILSAAAGATILTTHMAYADSTHVHNNNLGNHACRTDSSNSPVTNSCNIATR